jgi:hypothetical protein
MELTKAFILDEFIPALRSGQYEQTIGQLACEECFCATGVACDLLTKKYPERFHWIDEDFFDTEDVAIWVSEDGDEQETIPISYDAEPPNVLNNLTDPAFWSDIIKMNDGDGDWWDDPQTFDQIADWIEEHKEEYGLV